MAIRKIAQIGHPVLRQIAREVTREELRIARRCSSSSTISSRRCATPTAPASPRSRSTSRSGSARSRCATTRATRTSRTIPLTILVNPVLTPVGDEMFDNNEGCLSVPEPARRGEAPRRTCASRRGTARATRSTRSSTGSRPAPSSTRSITSTARSSSTASDPTHVRDVDRVRAPPQGGVRRAGAAARRARRLVAVGRDQFKNLSVAVVITAALSHRGPDTIEKVPILCCDIRA